MKCIIDTDPGIDDALAICFALGASDVDVVALTTVFGNLPSIRTISDNAQKVLNLARRKDILIHEGAATPLVFDGNRETYITQTSNAQSVRIHGMDGLGDVQPPLEGKWTPNEISAAECIIKHVKAHPHEITLVMLGPLTNLALAIMLYPEITLYIKQVVVMGGALFSPRGNELDTPDSNRGNVTSSSEANIYKDPFSARKVIKAGLGPEKLVFVTLDLTTMTNYECSGIASTFDEAGALGSFLKQAHESYMAVYKSFGRAKVPFHDSSAVYYALHPESFVTRDVSMDIETSGELSFGMTVLDARGGKASNNVRICTSIDTECFYDSLKQSILALHLHTLSPASSAHLDLK